MKFGIEDLAVNKKGSDDVIFLTQESYQKLSFARKGNRVMNDDMTS